MATFNPEQLCSYSEARALRDALNADPRFAAPWNILPGDDEFGNKPVSNPNFPWLPPTYPQIGIFVPPWEPGPHSDPVPFEPPDRYWLHFRIAAKPAIAFNVGLMIDRFRRYPNAPNYVVGQLSAEIRSA